MFVFLLLDRIKSQTVFNPLDENIKDTTEAISDILSLAVCISFT